MKCPTCPDVTLVITERVGIEIDYCPTCRGLWLDRGELDKILARTGDAPRHARPEPDHTRTLTPDRRRDDDWDARDWDDDDRHDDRRPGGRRRKRSMLGELFDF